MTDPENVAARVHADSFLIFLWPRVLIIAGAGFYRWLEPHPWNSILAGICFATAVRVLECKHGWTKS